MNPAIFCASLMALSALPAVGMVIAAQRSAPTPVRVICTVGTPWSPEACWVEFGSPVTGPRVQVADRADGEELVAILLANPGAVYTLDDGLQRAAKPKAQGRARGPVDSAGGR